MIVLEMLAVLPDRQGERHRGEARSVGEGDCGRDGLRSESTIVTCVEVRYEMGRSTLICTHRP